VKAAAGLLFLALACSAGAWAGDVERGRALLLDRQKSLCLLCHAAPVGDARLQGDLATNLAGAGSRWGAAQLRERLVEGQPGSLMPVFGRRDGLANVGAEWRDKPILTPEQIEDLVAYLQTLR
jgi:sulfur-oxidizing protein SoxX